MKYRYEYGIELNFSIYTLSGHVSYLMLASKLVSAGDQKWRYLEGFLPSDD